MFACEWTWFWRRNVWYLYFYKLFFVCVCVCFFWCMCICICDFLCVSPISCWPWKYFNVTWECLGYLTSHKHLFAQVNQMIRVSAGFICCLLASHNRLSLLYTFLSIYFCPTRFVDFDPKSPASSVVECSLERSEMVGDRITRFPGKTKIFFFVLHSCSLLPTKRQNSHWNWRVSEWRFARGYEKCRIW